MFLVMGITGKVGGATAEHLLAHDKEVRALVRNREKAANWANQSVDLVDGDWNDSATIERALKGVEGAFVMLPSVWAPSPDYKEGQRRDCKLCRGAHQGSAAASGCAFVDGCEQNQRAWDDHGLVASRARVSRPDIPNRICARRWILRKLPLRLAGRLPGRKRSSNSASRRATPDLPKKCLEADDFLARFPALAPSRA
jgi:hypothetical protein